jgi:hypothetical protein
MSPITVPAAALVAVTTMGIQPADRPEWGEPLLLLQMEKFRVSLGLDEQRARAVSGAADEAEDADPASRRRRLAELLGEPQLGRLEELRLQHLGGGALFDPEVRERFGVDEQQVERIGAIRRSLQGELDQRLSQVRLASPEQRADFIARFWRESGGLLETLTDLQRQRFRQAQGEPDPRILKPVGSP